MQGLIISSLCALLFLSSYAAQEPKYTFDLAGCFVDNTSDRDLPYNVIVGGTNEVGIGSTSSMSYTLCARACQMKGYKYAGVQNGNECRCGNSYNKFNQASSNCNTPCTGDSTEMCGGSSVNYILDISKVAGTICPAANMNDGGLCCPLRSSFQLVDQDVIDFLNTLFPEIDFKANPTPSSLTQQQLAERAAYLSYTASPNVFFATRGSLNFTFVADGAGYRNQFGYFLIDGNGKVIPNSYKDIFGEASWDKRKGGDSFPYKSCISELGLTATIGPFEVGTGVGFFIHANGVNAMTDSCKGNEVLKACLRSRGSRDYACYNENGCSIDPGKDPVNGMHTYHSIDSENGDGQKRHVALIQTRLGYVLGFEDLWDLGDQDYNDAMFIMQSDAELIGTFPKQCDPDCYKYNGKCDFSVGKCVCTSPSNVTYTSETCECNTCTSCSSSGGICECHTQKCICQPGYTHSSPNANDCACSTDVGTCYGIRGTFNCGTCVCDPNYENPGTTPTTGSYKYDFGASTQSPAPGYILDSGKVISGTTFGSFGWSSSHTDKAYSYGDQNDPDRSNVFMRNGADWSIYLTANTAYDIKVSFGSQAESRHSLEVIGTTTVTLVNDVLLGVNQYQTYTTRITATGNGLIKLKEPGKGSDLTRITFVEITIPPCSCISCTGGCGNGQCDCMTGKCVCPEGFTGKNCNECTIDKYGANCTDCDCGKGTCSSGISGTGKCTCQSGWTGTKCDTCLPGFYGPNCLPCPNCVPNQGSCSDGSSGSGKCVCVGNFGGNICNQCVAGTGGKLCTPCPDCGPGSCSEGITGTGKCNCPSNFVDSTNQQATNVNQCNACANQHYGPTCLPCPDCGNGVCNSGINGNGKCTCYPGWSGPDCDTCQDGFYGSNCNPCPIGCSLCSGNTNQDVVCTDCTTDYLLSSGACVQNCTGGYSDGSNCQPCSPDCASCTGPDSNQCTSCPQNQSLFNGTCVNECEDGYFSNSNAVCTPCHPKCNTCTGSTTTDCSSCEGQLYLNGKSCDNTCPEGTFANTNNNQCDPCGNECLTCSGATNSDCLTCENTILNGKNCVEVCPDGKFKNPVTNTCDECFFTCAKCNGGDENNCLACDGSLNLHNATCITPCPPGTYASNNVCLPCHGTCATCNQGPTEESNNCLSCEDDLLFLEGECLVNCPTGYYETPNGISCTPCEECQNCANGNCVCETGACDCTGTNFSGPLCDCSILPCPGDCSGKGQCQCGKCVCDPKLYFGDDCSCDQCPGVSPCSGNGVCNCNGTCTCQEGFVGKDCSVACVYDECGVCFGNGRTCAGCDRIPNSGKVFDSCLVCGGNNSTCAGCDGVPNSKKIYDRCGLCGGDGTTCVNQILCGKRKDCESCNQGVGQDDVRKCVWCNDTMGCIPIDDKAQCSIPWSECTEKPSPFSGDEFTGNQSNGNQGALIGGLVAGGVAIAAVAGLVLLARMKKGPLYFQPPDLDQNPAAFNNPLYQEYSPAFENPIYQAPQAK